MAKQLTKDRVESGCSELQRILIVDDEEVIRTGFRNYLQKAGFDTDEADCGEAALERIYHFDPHVVLLDILMPGVMGNELVETIKEWRPELQVIMVTSVAKEEIKSECLAKGAFAVLNKPVSMSVLTSTIRKSLERRETQVS